MAQVGWKVWLGKEEGWQDYDFDSVIEWARTYPQNFHYNPAVLRQIKEQVSVERDYLSPTMFSSCIRQQVLKRNLDYYVPVYQNWATMRGTGFHQVMADGENEPNAVVEETLELFIGLENGEAILFKGTPDKYLREVDNTATLMDYKTVKDLEARAKSAWTAQLSCYAWMLHELYKLTVTRAFVDQIHLMDLRRVEVPLWSLEDTAEYIKIQAEKFIGVFDGTYNMDNLPPMLDPVADKDLYWLCNSGWCPVEKECKALNLKQMKEAKNAGQGSQSKLPLSGPVRRGRGRSKSTAPPTEVRDELFD